MSVPRHRSCRESNVTHGHDNQIRALTFISRLAIAFLSPCLISCRKTSHGRLDARVSSLRYRATRNRRVVAIRPQCLL